VAFLLRQRDIELEEMLTGKTGIVHRNCKDRGEKNSVVYGIAADGYTFQIVKIDNKSKVRSCRVIQGLQANCVFSCFNLANIHWTKVGDTSLNILTTSWQRHLDNARNDPHIRSWL
jgi:hypothetical protein